MESGFAHLETVFTVFTVAWIGILLWLLHISRQPKKQPKLERVPVRIKRNSLK